jgi:hypothetical protein
MVSATIAHRGNKIVITTTATVKNGSVSYADQLMHEIACLKSADGARLAQAKNALLEFLPHDMAKEGGSVNLPLPTVREELYKAVFEILTDLADNALAHSDERRDAAREIAHAAISSSIPEISEPMICGIANCLLEGSANSFIDAHGILRDAAVLGDQKARGRIIGIMRAEVEKHPRDARHDSYLHRKGLLFGAIKNRIGAELE